LIDFFRKEKPSLFIFYLKKAAHADVEVDAGVGVGLFTFVVLFLFFLKFPGNCSLSRLDKDSVCGWVSSSKRLFLKLYRGGDLVTFSTNSDLLGIRVLLSIRPSHVSYPPCHRLTLE